MMYVDEILKATDELNDKGKYETTKIERETMTVTISLAEYRSLVEECGRKEERIIHLQNEIDRLAAENSRYFDNLVKAEVCKR